MMAAILLQASGGGFGGFLIPLGLMFPIMYFMVIMPQQRQRKKVQAMLADLKAGDKIITSGGIYGTVNGIDGDSVILASRVRRLLRWRHRKMQNKPTLRRTTRLTF